MDAKFSLLTGFSSSRTSSTYPIHPQPRHKPGRSPAAQYTVHNHRKVADFALLATT